jgi:hypothetical protein
MKESDIQAISACLNQINLYKSMNFPKNFKLNMNFSLSSGKL